MSRKSAWSLKVTRTGCGRCGGWGGVWENTEAGICKMHAGNDRVALQCTGDKCMGDKAGPGGCLSSLTEALDLAVRQ